MKIISRLLTDLVNDEVVIDGKLLVNSAYLKSIRGMNNEITGVDLILHLSVKAKIDNLEIKEYGIVNTHRLSDEEYEVLKTEVLIKK